MQDEEKKEPTVVIEAVPVPEAEVRTMKVEKKKDCGCSRAKTSKAKRE